jgi:hypothetical protein
MKDLKTRRTRLVGSDILAKRFVGLDVRICRFESGGTLMLVSLTCIYTVTVPGPLELINSLVSP